MNKSNPSRKIHLLSGILAILLSFSLSLTIYLLFIQTPLLGKRELLAAILLFVVLIFPSYFMIDRFLLAQFREYSPRGKTFLILSSILFGFFIILTTNYPPLYFASPDHTLKIQVPIVSGDNAVERTVSVIWITTGLGDVSFSKLQKEGGWEKSETGISHTGPQPASLFWEGKPGDKVMVELQKTPYSNPILVTWDGQETSINLEGSPGSTLTITQPYNSKNAGFLLAIFILWFSSGILFLSITMFLLTREIKGKPFYSRGKYSWLFFTLPMIAVWGVYLLTFFPGMMSFDSNQQWGQLISGQFNDAHPVFHTLSMWLVTRIWFSPAAVVISQILFLSLSVAWGIRLLEDHGLPDWAGWLLAAIFAIAPLNGNMVLVLWKDIPYSTSLFLLSLMILKIVLTKGIWLEKRFTWVWLGLVSLCVASFRHNGFPVPLASLIALLIFYRKWWKYIVQAAVMSLVVYGVIHGPLYKALRVEQPTSGTFEHILMHHIAAHINTGQPLTPSEQALADSIVPGSQWGYNCCSALSTSRTTGLFDEEKILPSSAIRTLYLELAVKEPAVELEHLKCVSSIVWRSPGFCGANTLLPINSASWISGYPEKHISEKSLIPFFQKPLSHFLISLRINATLTLLISPAVYLWFGVYATAIFSIRRKNWKGLLFILPVVTQETIYGIINLSDNYRYHYGAYLVGLFGLGLLILALLSPIHKDKNE